MDRNHTITTWSRPALHKQNGKPLFFDVLISILGIIYITPPCPCMVDAGWGYFCFYTKGLPKIHG
jgi:hypothetical protein